MELSQRLSDLGDVAMRLIEIWLPEISFEAADDFHLPSSIEEVAHPHSATCCENRFHSRPEGSGGGVTVKNWPRLYSACEQNS